MVLEEQGETPNPEMADSELAGEVPGGEDEGKGQEKPTV
jgi:hypothetical protein